MSKLAGELAKATSTKSGPTCTVALILAELDEADRTALREALENRRMPATAIAEALRNVGIEVAAATLARHRNRARAAGCRCPRD